MSKIERHLCFSSEACILLAGFSVMLNFYHTCIRVQENCLESSDGRRNVEESR